MMTSTQACFRIVRALARVSALAMAYASASGALAAGDARKAASEATTCANPERTLSFDVIDLVAGKEVQGRADLSIERDGITYLFATSEHMKIFAKDPAKYEVADGGACARMGPLSGRGDARRFLVHDGRVYFFASDGCREGFKKNPAACLERAEPRIEASAEDLARGADLMDKMVEWAGGHQALRDMKSYREVTEKDRSAGQRVYRWKTSAAARFPNDFMVYESWDESWFSTIRSGEGAAMASASRGTEPIGGSRAEAFDRVVARRPIVILKEWAMRSGRDSNPRTGAPRLQSPETIDARGPRSIIAAAAGEREVDGVKVALVKVWIDGAMSIFAIDPATGRPIEQSFKGREGPTSVGEVTRRFTADRMFYGVRLPTAWSVTFNGKNQPEMAVLIDRFEINPTLDDELFAVRAVPAPPPRP